MVLFLSHLSAEEIGRALEAWQWIGLDRCTPIAVTAFADVFFQAPDGIRFLDTLEGTFDRVARDEQELARLLESPASRDQYLLEGLVRRAHAEGRLLQAGEAYSFALPPVLGGKLDYENIEVQSFVVALHLSGQIHEQVKRLPAGAQITGFNVVEG